MKSYHALYLFLLLTRAFSFMTIPISSTFNKHRFMSLTKMNYYMTSDYLQNIDRLEKVKKNITNYIKEKKDDKKLEKGFKSTYQPIPKTSFDSIFLSIYHVSKVYMSANMDRFIFELNTGRKYVFYVHDKEDHDKMIQIINIIPHNVKHIIINDVHNCMDDSFGFLFCEPK